MKKSLLLHAELSYVLAQMGHGDTLCIADSGLPIPEDVFKIELALTAGVPSLLQVLTVILSELHIEKAIAATEAKKVIVPWSHRAHPKAKSSAAAKKAPPPNELTLSKWFKLQLQTPITFVSHENFKKTMLTARAIIRTGEQTPYANVILQSGVVF